MGMDSSPGSIIWHRLERRPAASGNESVSQPATTTQPVQPAAARIPWRFLDALGTTFWTYWALKIFIADIDRVLIAALAPSALPLLDYRAVAYLALLVLTALFLRRWFLYMAYIAGFPLVVLFWKIPFFLMRHRSWPMFLAILQAGSVVLGDLRYNVITKSLAVIAAVFVVTTDDPIFLLPSAVCVAFLLVWSFARRLRRMFGSSSFIEVQRRTIRRLLSSQAVQAFVTLKDEYRTIDIDRYDEAQAQQVALTISYGIGLTKILDLWAYQLDRYRHRYSPSAVFALVTYAWVFIASLAALTLLNLTLLKLSPGEFAVASPRPLVAVLAYTLSTFTLGEAGGMHPVGQLAYAMQVAGALTGGFIVASLVISAVITFVRERDDTATQELVAELKDEARKQEQQFMRAYAVTPDEAYERLRQIGAAATGVIAYLVQSIPHELADENRP